MRFKEIDFRISQGQLFWIFGAYVAIVHLAIDQGFVLTRFSQLGIRAGEIISWSEYLSKRSVFILLHLAAIGSTVFLALSRHRTFGVGFLLLLYVGTFFDMSYFFIASRYPNFSDVSTLLEAVGQAPEAIQEYKLSVFKAGGVVTVWFSPILAIALLRRPTQTIRGSTRLAAALIGILAILYFFLLGAKSEAGLVGFPRGFSSAFAAVTASVANPKLPDTQFEHLSPYPNLFSPNKIIVLMDESVTGDHFKAQVEGTHIPNSRFFSGLVFSGANISAASNYYFRKGGLTTAGVVQIAGLFQLAQTNGYRTTYIDNQGVLVDPGAKNYMDAKELAYISQVISNATLPRHERDAASLNQLITHIDTTTKEFIYVNKLGAHVPYESTVKPESRTSDRLENYRRSIRENSVNYLEELAKHIGRNAVVIYTSDHGQNFGPGPTHGNSGQEAAITEWDVPFGLISGNSNFLANIDEAPSMQSAFITHFDISELVRNLMGYGMNGSCKILDSKTIAHKETSFCAFYGPPHGSVGHSSQGPKCRVIRIGAS